MFRRGQFSFKLGDIEKEVDEVLRIRRKGKGLLKNVVNDWNDFGFLMTMFPDGHRLEERRGQDVEVMWVDVDDSSGLPLFYEEESRTKTPFCIFEDCYDWSRGNATFTCPDHEVSIRHFIEGEN